MDDWSYDNDRWCFLEPCRVLLCCQWQLGVPLNACAHVTDLQWTPGGNVGEIIQWHTSHQNFYSTGQWRVRTACEAQRGETVNSCFHLTEAEGSVLFNGLCVYILPVYDILLLNISLYQLATWEPLCPHTPLGLTLSVSFLCSVWLHNLTCIKLIGIYYAH